ncbi:MAG: nuclease [Acidobacteria bacterium]|nr:MAG: nuclease [Acidobacteriota bacterium]
MPIRTAIWKVALQPEPLPESVLAKEQLLEDMIVAAPGLVSDEWMLIGRQEDTGFGGRIDLLAIAPDGSLVLIELKRDRTPREVVAQALDYACWVDKLRPEDIANIYSRFAPNRSLAQDFRERFGQDLDEETLNQNHQIIIVAASLDDSTERIVEYLSKRDIPINVLCFQVFGLGAEQLLTRTWLLDPVHSQLSSTPPPDGPNEPWNGEFYCSFGSGATRSWADAVQYGFICGGGGTWYSKTLQLLNPGDRVWVNVPQTGFVGVGRVTGRAQQAASFKVATPNGDVPVLDVVKGGSYHRDLVSDPERCEYFVPIQWLQTVPLEKAVQEIGLFGNQNTVCKPTTPKWRYTIERLKEKFPGFNRAIATAGSAAKSQMS